MTTPIIAIANARPDTGKTTTAYHMARVLAGWGVRVLAIDLDPQAGLTRACGVKIDTTPDICELPLTTTADVLRGYSDLPGARAELGPGRFLGLVPADARLREVASELTVRGLRLLRLQRALACVRSADVVLVDCPSTAGSLLYSALLAATHVLMPSQPAAWSIGGIGRTRQLLKEIRKETGAAPVELGVVVTRYDCRLASAQSWMRSLVNFDGGPGVVPLREGADADDTLRGDYAPVARNVLALLGLKVAGVEVAQ